MNRTPFAALAIAALFLLTTLPAPPAQARNVEACLPRTLIQMESGNTLGVNLDRGIWPSGGGFNPRAPWDWYASFHGSAGFDGRCAYATAGVGAFGVSFDTDPPKNDGAQGDSDGDGMGDTWRSGWETLSNLVLDPAFDTDSDGLLNVREFQWDLVPVCVPTHMNCHDFESNGSDGSNGDSWTDGPEVDYWNNPNNDNINIPALAIYDQDRLIDTDGDKTPNVKDKDSDNDGLIDGLEYNTLGSYPEFFDSDCELKATACTVSTTTKFFATNRVGNPGAGDGIWDGDERDAWNALAPGAVTTNFDGDGIANNLLDPDADNDGLLDGQEFLLGSGQVRPDVRDTEADGVIDGDEVAWDQDTDLDGFVNANDVDSDNDGMPDKWEMNHHFNMVDFTDAALDRDGDGLTNLGEYQHETDPSDMDSEGTSIEQGDLLLDGEEVNVYHTDPLYWDSDADGMADYFEIQNNFNPLDAADAAQDADLDSFDQNLDGTPELLWTNLKEYRYGRDPAYNEATQGPWLRGTNPRAWDTDRDGASDGYEAYYGTNPTLPADGNADEDQDGFNFTQEVRHGTSPTDPDTDNDGLCDGGRALNCFHPTLGSAPGQPGEVDYNSVGWSTDSDADGLSDWTEARMWDEGASGSAQDLDGDGLNGIVDADSDNDRLNDGPEVTRTTDPRLTDTDNDALKDGEEVLTYLTNPKDDDHDNDGLLDGAEVNVHHTKPKIVDTDGDTLGDGAEVNTHGTDPLLVDSDQDELPDGWEIQKGTQARTPDADVDLDGDGLSNHREYRIGTHPNDSDSEDDGLPDGYEDQYTLGAATYNPSSDADGDGLANLAEYGKTTNPRVADTDGDALSDGYEVNTAKTDPLTLDSDADGLGDGEEKAAWDAKSYNWNTDADGDTLTGLLDPDSDNDGLNDRDELVDAKTKPHVRDSDGDGLSDHEEVVGYGGQFNPNDPDTDDNGNSDGVDASLLDPQGDTDRDALKNGDETTYGTDPTEPDSDCDGVQDGPEVNYWGADWNTGGNRLLAADVDGDSLKDGVELGTVGTPTQAMYRTRPDAADTDGDGLQDNEEAQNNVKVACDAPQGASQQQSSSSPVWPTPGPALPPAPPVVSSGFVFLKDNLGWYLRGGYGVHLYLDDMTPEGFLMQQQSGGAPGKNGKCTDPSWRDTDGDGLSDWEEQSGAQNPYPQKYDTNGPPGNTNPCSPHSDQDGISDGLELGRGAGDAAWALKMNPNSLDTDGDRRLDNEEDSNRNGASDLTRDLTTGQIKQKNAGSAPAETDPTDADTDDDGVSDLDDISDKSGTSPHKWDTDEDGLSDGLELGRTEPVKDAAGSLVNYLGGLYTRDDITVFGLANWKTWQDFPTATENPGSYDFTGAIKTEPNRRDTDGDGIIDGFEDLNHNGIFGDASELLPTDADTDNDGLADGLELQIWSRPEAPYSFQNALQQWSATSTSVLEQKLTWNPGNLLQTDPRDPDTDGVDGVIDGLDVNPLGNTGLLLTFKNFKMLEMPDEGAGWGCWGCEGWRPDVKVSLGVTLPSGGGYTARTRELAFPDSQQGFDLGVWLAGQADIVDQSAGNNPTSPIGLAQLAWTGGSIAMDLFDTVSSYPPAGQCKDVICLSLQFREIDGWNDPDNDVDLHHLDKRTFYGQGGVQDLTLAFAASPCASTVQTIPTMRGAGDPNDENGELSMVSQLTVFQNFLENARIHNGAPNSVVTPDITRNPVPSELAGGCP